MSTLEQRFWSKVDTTGGLWDCWPYTGAVRGREGYGAFFRDGRQQIASRVALELSLGRPLSPDAEACHSCDNPLCCNPAHLFVADHASNIADKVAKRRQAVGERVGSAKLTAEQVAEIRQRYTGRRGEATEIASEYGVSLTTMHQVVTRKWWRHVA